MNDQNSKNFMGSILEAQKSMVDTLVENTKKVTQGNDFISQTMDKGSETYNNWMSKQKEVVEKMAQKAESVTDSMNESTSKVKEDAKTWFESQMNWAKQAWEMNQEFIKKATPSNNSMNLSNPMEWMMDMGKKMNETFTQAQNAQNWMSMMQKFNPANASDLFKNSASNWNTIYNQYTEVLNNSFSELQKTMQNATTGDAYKNMIDVASGFSKFNEIWAPFMKSIQEKTFTLEEFKKSFNFESSKELMDKFFQFMPQGSQQYMDQAKEMWTKNMKSFMEMNKGQFHSNKEMLASMNPFGNQNFFEQMMSGYQNMNSAFQNAVSPISKMMTPNQFSESAKEWSGIADRMAVYQIKNAELQYMMYQKGNEVMESLAENIYNKMENGVEINNMTELYQEFLKINDKAYVSLFESDEYSKLMAETSAMQLKLKKEMELQTEKMLVNVPVATRSEMDEMYKVIYDLKKQVHQLQKMLDLEPVMHSGEATSSASTSEAETPSPKANSKRLNK